MADELPGLDYDNEPPRVATRGRRAAGGGGPLGGGPLGGGGGGTQGSFASAPTASVTSPLARPSPKPKGRPLSLDDDSSGDEVNTRQPQQQQQQQRASVPSSVRASPMSPVAVRPSAEVEKLRAEVKRLEEVAKSAQDLVKQREESCAAQAETLHAFELRVQKAELEAAKLQEERKIRDDTAAVLQSEREAVKREYEETRREAERLRETNRSLKAESEEADALRNKLKDQEKRAQELKDRLSVEERRCRELQDSMRDPSVLPYTPPPQADAIGRHVPQDAPLSLQMQVMLHNATEQVIGYQKAREEAMMQSLRAEQQRWTESVEEREKAREEVQRREIEKWRVREQEERLERERRDAEERILRAQRDEQERTDRENRHRREKAELMQQEVSEREAWASRVQDEHQQTLERVTLGFTTTQEQMLKAHEQQLRSVHQQAESERVALRQAHNQQLDNMKTRYEKLMKTQEEAHQTSLTAFTSVKDSAQKLTEIHAQIRLTTEEHVEMKRVWVRSLEEMKRSQEETIQDKQALLEELRLNVAEKHQQLDNERIMLSRLFADFKTTINNISRQQEDERNRLTASVVKAEKAREEYEREHKKWMRDCLKQKMTQEADYADAVHKVLGAVEQLQQEHAALQNTRASFERQKEAHLRHASDLEVKVEEQKREVEEAAQRMATKEATINEAGKLLDRRAADLQRENEELSLEKEKLRDELYRVKELGSAAYQKSKELQRMRDEIRAAAAAVEQNMASQARQKDAKQLDQDRFLLERERFQLEKEKTRHLIELQAAIGKQKEQHTDPQAVSAVTAPQEQRQPQQATLGPADYKELLDQKTFLQNVRGGTAISQNKTPSTSEGGGGDLRRRSIPRPSPAPDPTQDTFESLLAQPWVSLFRLSDDSTSDSPLPRQTPSTSGPYSSSPGGFTSTT